MGKYPLYMNDEERKDEGIRQRRLMREAFRQLIKPMTFDELVFATLQARYPGQIEEWQIKASEAGWMPPKDWYEQDIQQISFGIRKLAEHKWVTHDRDWNLVRQIRNHPLEMLAEQAEE